MQTDSKTYGIGIVGCGNISNTHAEAISKSNKGILIAAHSRTESTLEAFCKQHGTAGYPSYKKFLANPNLDIVVICTPTGTHLDYGVLAAKAGKHVIVEKPIEVTVDRGYSLMQSCKNNGVGLAVIYQSRFMNDVIHMKKVIDNKDIGNIFMASASVPWFRGQAYYSDSSWRGTFALDGGGAVINQSIHTIDLLQWFMGGVESVSAFKGTFTHEGIEAEDNAVACLRFTNGALGGFMASTSIVPARERRIEINGSQGTAFLEGDRFHKKLDTQQEDKKNDEATEATGAASPLAGMTAHHHRKQYEQIFKAIRKDTQPVVSGGESLQSLAIVEALYKAAEREEAVYIDEILSKTSSK